MTKYVFDVDGTLTPSRLPIDTLFKEFFKGWMRDKNVFLLTGSDAVKTIEQVGMDIWSKTISYQCAGNVIYAYGKKIYESDWPKEDDNIFETLAYCLDNPVYPYQTYFNQIEVRKGMVNFSELGRECPQEARDKYAEWDGPEYNSRLELVEFIKAENPNLDAEIGGQISIDIYPKGKNKGQVFNYLKDSGPIYFFGDKTMEGGNDYAFASKLEEPHKVFQVSGPEETEQILRGMV